MIDVISDTHIDFYIKNNFSIEDFCVSIMPENHGEVLLIAGDIGHNTDQNVEVLKFFLSKYKKVAIVFGNHCYYSQEDSESHINDSRDRYKELGIEILEGTSFEYNGIKIGGGSGWCDLTYGKEFGFTEADVYNMFYHNFSDYNWIDSIPRDFFSYRDWYIKKKQELENVLDCDIIISHYPFDEDSIAPKYARDVYTSFFKFDGSNFYDKLDGKIWVAGHTHTPYDYKKNGTRFVNNALGYPFEYNEVKIKTIL